MRALLEAGLSSGDWILFSVSSCAWMRAHFDIHRNDKPRTCSGVVRIDPLRFLDGCRTRRLNQALSVLSLSIVFLRVVVY